MSRFVRSKLTLVAAVFTVLLLLPVSPAGAFDRSAAPKSIVPSTVVGIVVDLETLVPIPGVEAILASETVTFTTVSADDGFVLFTVPAGVYELRLSAEGYTPTTYKNLLVEDGQLVVLQGAGLIPNLDQGRPGIPITKDASDIYSLAGKIIDNVTREFIEGATVRVTGTGQESKSTESGAFAFPVIASSSITLEVSAPGYYPEVVDFSRDGGLSAQTKDIYLQKDASSSAPDAFENDDSPAQASFIGVDADPQEHNFDEPGDPDWAQFYVAGPEIITIDTVAVGANADIVITVFGGDGSTQLDQVNDIAGGGAGETLLFQAAQAGVYFVRITDANPEASGENTQYTLRVYREQGSDLPCTIAGFVTNAATRAPLAGATVRLDAIGSATVRAAADGFYSFSGIPSGSYTLVADAGAGYDQDSKLLIVSPGDVKSLDFELQPLTAADIDGNGKVDAVDIQIVINGALALPTEFPTDLDGDGDSDAVDIQLVINAALGL